MTATRPTTVTMSGLGVEGMGSLERVRGLRSRDVSRGRQKDPSRMARVSASCARTNTVWRKAWDSDRTHVTPGQSVGVAEIASYQLHHVIYASGDEAGVPGTEHARQSRQRAETDGMV